MLLHNIMRNHLAAVCLLSTVLLLSAPGGSARAGDTSVYRHVDQHGRVLFSDRPGPGATRMVRTWKGWVERRSASRAPGFDWKARQRQYDPFIRGLARRYDIPHTLLHAVITAESSYDPQAVSRTGAVGLMQLMPETARRYGVQDRTRPRENIRAGVRYLSDLLKMFNHDLELALAAYNAGENAVLRHGNRIPPYRETRRYVRKVLKFYQQYRKSMG